MKCLIRKASAFLFLLIPTLALAGWQVANQQTAMPAEPFFQAGTQQDTTFAPKASFSTSLDPKRANLSSNENFVSRFAYQGRPAAVYAISVSGSLKENLERIMDRYHWKVIWKAPFDYNFDGRINGSSLPNVISKLLKPFPLQAKLYMSNHIMIVVPRNA